MSMSITPQGDPKMVFSPYGDPGQKVLSEAQKVRHKTNLKFEAFLGARRARPGGYESSERPPPRTQAALRTRSHHAFRHVRAGGIVNQKRSNKLFT